MFDIKNIKIKVISRNDAKELVLKNHYMKTFPSGSKLCFAITCDDRILGVAVFGKSTSTDKKSSLFGISKNEIIEMQRLWISDLLGHNAESYTLKLIVKFFRVNYKKIKVIWTYSGGCKNDCGIVYQSSGFLYLGRSECNDFYLTDKGEYKNIINVMKFGKGNKKDPMEKRLIEIYGKGKIINSFRYHYFYPLCKGVRRKMISKILPFPKTSEIFRKDQKWILGSA